jgi:hypothetical protein
MAKPMPLEACNLDLQFAVINARLNGFPHEKPDSWSFQLILPESRDL